MKRLAWKIGMAAAVVLAAGVCPVQAGPYLSYTASLYDRSSGITFPAQTAGYTLTTVPPRNDIGPRNNRTFISQNGGTAYDVGPNFDYATFHTVRGQAVNNLGVVAGFDDFDATDAASIFIRTPNSPSDLSTGTFQDVFFLGSDLRRGQDPRFTFRQILALNDQDYILAAGTDVNGRQVSILLTPSFETPEPATLGAAVLGVMFGVTALRRRSRR